MSELYHAVQLSLFPSKVCTGCLIEKPLECFHKSGGRGKYGHDAQCKDCKRIRDKLRHERIGLSAKQTITSKVCNRCNIEKPVTDFFKDRTKPSGYKSYCKACQPHFEVVQQSAVAYFKLCVSCHTKKPLSQFDIRRAQKDGHNYICKTCKSVFHKTPEYKRYAKKYNGSAKGKAKLYERRRTERYRRSQREFKRKPEQRIKTAARHKANHEHLKKLARLRYLANPLSARERRMRRVALQQKASSGRVSYKRILEQHGYICHICNDKIDMNVQGWGKLHFDHVIPISRGGSHTADNIKPAHAVCNLRKKNMLMEELTPWHRRGVQS